MIDRDFILPLFILFLSCCTASKRHGFPSETLHLNENHDPKHDKGHVAVFDSSEEQLRTGDDLVRSKRDAAPSNENITTWVTPLNDSHQQLMVHWVGEGSSVIICMARDATQRTTGPGIPSAVYISYDYGNTFINKTENFRMPNRHEESYAQLDKFYNHPKINSYCVFTDIKNKMLYQTSDNGLTFRSSELSFSPSDLSYDEEDPDKFVILDKVDTMRKLYMTRDGGVSFKPIEEYVKSFYWTSGPDHPPQFYIERAKPFGSNAVLAAPRPEGHNFKELIDDVQDFQIKNDFMFATKKSGEKNLDLYISYQRGPFVKAEFQTELDLREFHVSDVTGTRIFISVSHADTQTNLYVSEISKQFTEFKFVLSLESILCYFPNSTWKNSWLNEVAESSFVDLYRVEGLRGIYIASKVNTKPSGVNIGPEHLTSYISYDHGNTWSTIRPPSVDEEGRPLPCTAANDCSLHLSQKFSQLYPITRSVTIMSSKSAPGIIMATGVVGKSLKGHPGVFISRDAGITWKQILKDYYFLNYGDHGGALVAVRYYKTRGETREILYSTDEGERWLSHQFNVDDLRVYGLMTEPGENTTVFTMFGSAKGLHQWIIIKVDLFNAFSYNCTMDDYKYWSPSSIEVGSRVPCILGSTDTYQRRIPHTNCYNGQNYNRPVKKEICECDRHDFECDFGFVSTGNPFHCIHNKTLSKFDPYAVPGHCEPGQFYNRTKGYRKIDGDVCIDGYEDNYLPDLIPCPMNETVEFLIVAQKNKIVRINLSNNNTKIFPIKDLKSVIAIEFDMKNNCLYWADIVTDVIGRQCLSNGTYYPEILVKTDLASIEGMALDWISNVLFFVDGTRTKIEAIRTDLSNKGRMRRTILDSKDLTKPRGIAVHPTAGYLFWTDWAPADPSVCRSNLDGTDIKKLFTKPTVLWPNGITVDHIAERIYFTDAMEDYIASADLNGERFKKIFANDEKVSHPFAVAVFKDTVFWDDWKAKSIFSADKDHGIPVTTIRQQMPGLMDLKVFSHSLQVGSNACSQKGNTCETLCLGLPKGGFSCLCPDGLTRKDGKCLCPDGKPANSNMTCASNDSDKSCLPGSFTCSNGLCIPSNWRCDENNDCGDNSDEIGCTPTVCPPNSILCDTHVCIPHYYKCDHQPDCQDGTDEKDCHFNNCTAEQFQCKNGKCIPTKWKCDREDDCRDGSDEADCETSANPKCSKEEFTCPSNGQCIPLRWTCDGERDCVDGADEAPKSCKDVVCEDFMFSCPGNGKCIYPTRVCDGQDDCKDGSASDEHNCTGTGTGGPTSGTVLPPIQFPAANHCSNWMFRCNSSRCIPYWWKCDSVRDCEDGEDELGCPPQDLEPHRKIKPQGGGNGIDPPIVCKKNHFMCPNGNLCSGGECIPSLWVCDGGQDCSDGEDEKNCASRTGSGLCRGFRCHSDGACVSQDSVCDGVEDCKDGSDEKTCSPQVIDNNNRRKPNNKPITCGANEFSCDKDDCISRSLRCDGRNDCMDGSDEQSCTEDERMAVLCRIKELNIIRSESRNNSLTVSWSIASTTMHFQFLPSISEVNGPSRSIWKNSTWTTDKRYTFTDLQPYTEYNMTVYVKKIKNGNHEGYPPVIYKTGRTAEGEPSPPFGVIARQKSDRVEVQWSPPTQRNGEIIGYTVMMMPPVPPFITRAPANATSVLLHYGNFKPGHDYNFWVVASNARYESNSSDLIVLQFDALGDIDNLKNLSLTKINASSVMVSWLPIKGVDGYIVTQSLRPPYPSIEEIKITANNVTLTNLSPGLTYKIEVLAYTGSMRGKPLSLTTSTAGTKLPAISNFNGSVVNNTSVHLSWDSLKSTLPGTNIMYAIHYGLTYEELIQAPKLISENTAVRIDNLLACDSYLFNIGLIKPSLGPLNTETLDLRTTFNPIAPVKNLEVTRSGPLNNIMTLTWDASCKGLVGQQPAAYIITVLEVSQLEKSVLRTAPTSNSSMRHVFDNMEFGGVYNISVRRDFPGSGEVHASIAGPVLPPPHQVELWRNSDNSYVLSWKGQKIPGLTIPYSYEVLIADDSEDKTVRIVNVHNSTMAVFDDLSVGKNYSLSVRVVTTKNLRSLASEPQSVSPLVFASQQQAGTGMSLFIGVPLACIAVVACAALGVLLLKHRRLSTSFARFANPRYDSRSGAATLGNADILDEDDSPPIRGFSDDEPLVIA